MPAIKWLLDEVTFSPDAEKHAVYYIPHLETLDILQLPRQQHFMYSREQLKPGWERFKTGGGGGLRDPAATWWRR